VERGGDECAEVKLFSDLFAGEKKGEKRVK
jgi:hypothetical protein